MSLLYRSPNVMVDDAEWHVQVVQTGPCNRPVTRYMWRRDGGEWSTIASWGDRLPKGLNRHFRTYRKSINTAIASARIKPRVSVYQDAA